MSAVTVARNGFPVPLEQAPQCVEWMVDGLLRGLKSLDAIIARPVGVPSRDGTYTRYIPDNGGIVRECCGDPGDCHHECDARYDHWYRQGPRP